MTTPLYEQYLKSQGKPEASTPLYEQFLKESAPAGPSGMDIHEEYRRGLLGAKLKRQQQNDEERSALDAVGPLDAAGKAVTATMLNIGQVIPGMKSVQAGIGAGLSHLPGMDPMTYAQSLKAVDESTGKIPIGTRILGQAVASPALGPLMPVGKVGLPFNVAMEMTPAKVGALLGYADQALAPELDKGNVERFGKGAVGAVIGGFTGHVLDKAGTMVKARRTLTPQDNIIARQAARAESAHRLYGAAQSEGERNGANAAVRSFIAEPDIAERIASLKTLEQYQNVAEDSPEMIAALARSMSDEAKTLSKGMGQVDPSKPNTLMEKAKSLGRTKKRLLKTVSEPSVTTKPPIMLDVAGTNFETAYKPPLTFDVPATNVQTPYRPPLMQDLPAPRAETNPLFSHQPLPGAERGQATRILGRDEGMTGPMTSAARPPQTSTIPERPVLQGPTPQGTAGGGWGEQAQIVVEPNGRVVVVSPRDVQGPAAPGFVMQGQPATTTTLPGREARHAFRLRQDPEKLIRPGVEIGPPETMWEPAAGRSPLGSPTPAPWENPTWRGQIETAPEIPGVSLESSPMRVQTAPAVPGVSLSSSPMRVQLAPAETITEPAMMPSFADASADFARRTREIEAVGKGMNAIQGASKNSTPTFNQIQSKNTKTPETFAAWFKTATDAEKQAAIEGILGDVRNSASLPGKTFAPLRRRAGDASNILRNVDPTSSEEILRLLGGINAFSSK